MSFGVYTRRKTNYFLDVEKFFVYFAKDLNVIFRFFLCHWLEESFRLRIYDIFMQKVITCKKCKSWEKKYTLDFKFCWWKKKNKIYDIGRF